MRYREATPQLDVFSLLSHEQAVTQVIKGINILSKVIDWELFREELESILGYAQRDWSKGGRPPIDPVLMFKVLVLQKFHDISGIASRMRGTGCANDLGFQAGIGTEWQG